MHSALRILCAWLATCLLNTQLVQAAVFEELHGFLRGPATPSGEAIEGPDGALYGTTSGGGTNNLGTVYRLTQSGELTTLVSFKGTNGAYPEASLARGRSGIFYGTTRTGGAYGRGTVFRVTANGEFTSVFSFDGTNGEYPRSPLTLGSDGAWYGCAYSGGSSNQGTVFRLTTDGVVTPLAYLTNPIGCGPVGRLVEGPDGAFYGTTAYGQRVPKTSDSGGGKRDGTPGGGKPRGGGPPVQPPRGWTVEGPGTLFRVTTNGALSRLESFTWTNAIVAGDPPARLAFCHGEHLYGLTRSGGSANLGTIFRMTTNGVMTSLHEFLEPDGADPTALIQGSDGLLYGTTYSQSVSIDTYTNSGSADVFEFRGSVGPGSLFRLARDGGDFTRLATFVGANGDRPVGLIEGSDGVLYGTTTAGRGGAIFRATTSGELSTVAPFIDRDGVYPRAPLVAGPDGSLYGTTSAGGDFDHGTVFKIAPDGGPPTRLLSFAGTNGAYPAAALTPVNGVFYGTTAYGGQDGKGTVFCITTNEVFTSLLSFSGTNGAFLGACPETRLVPGPEGNLFGITPYGGTSNLGTVFQLALDGTLTASASFGDTNGAYPNSLALDLDGALYGTTSWGGISNLGTIFRFSSGGITSVASFVGANGAFPSGLVRGVDGAFYGTTSSGGDYDRGTVFRVGADGVPVTLRSLVGSDPAYPHGNLTPGPGNALYGTTADGTIFLVRTNGVSAPLHRVTDTTDADLEAGRAPTQPFNLGGHTPTSPAAYLIPKMPGAAFTIALDERGTIYGTADEDGSRGGGVIFRVQAWSALEIAKSAEEECVVRLTGQPGTTYALESADTVVGPWQTVTNLTTPTADLGHGIGVVEFSEPVGAAPQRFYRTVFPAY